MKVLYLIPARGGSKGLPGKNIKILGDKPLIVYSIEFAMKNIKEGDELCISTDDKDAIEIAEKMGVNVPFIRPAVLASDSATSYDVIMHALEYYDKNDKNFDAVLLLQPTSPFRNQQDFENLILNYNDDVEMVVSVKLSKENPYFTLFEENEFGFLNKSKIGNFERRQDCPEVFAYNGSMYLMKINALKNRKINEFKKIKKILMPEKRSIDIDTMADWILAEFYLDKQ
jgi:CMP-N,N'-diacetyllegionaminic acid synthase